MKVAWLKETLVLASTLFCLARKLRVRAGLCLLLGDQGTIVSLCSVHFFAVLFWGVCGTPWVLSPRPFKTISFITNRTVSVNEMRGLTIRRNLSPLHIYFFRALSLARGQIPLLHRWVKTSRITWFCLR